MKYRYGVSNSDVLALGKHQNSHSDDVQEISTSPELSYHAPNPCQERKGITNAQHRQTREVTRVQLSGASLSGYDKVVSVS